MRTFPSTQTADLTTRSSVALRYRHPLAKVSVRPWNGGVGGGSRAGYDQQPRANARGGAALRDARLARLEAALFVAKEPLSSRRLGQIANLADGTEARTLTRRLNEYYDREGCAFRVEEVAGGFRLLTRPQFGSWLRQVHPAHLELRLSPPALETLAIVAYRQPVLRAAVEAIRGVQCGEMLRQLMERDLVRIVGRSQELGRPYLFGTTKRFLQLFGLRHIDELPRAQQLRAAALEANVAAHAPSANSGLLSTAVRQEESDVKTTVEVELPTLSNSLGGTGILSPVSPLGDLASASYVRASDDDDDFDDDDEDEDEDEDEEEDDLEDGEWEEVDDDEDEDEDEEEDEDFDDEDDDWEDEDEDDDDWDDEDEDEDEEDEDEEDED